MTSPPRGQPQPATAAAPAAAAAAATSPQLPAASHPLPRAFLASSSPLATAAAPAPPLFTGRPLNPNPPGHGSTSVPHGILYPVLRSASTSNSGVAAATAHLRRVPPMAVGYPRTHAVAVPIAQQQQPLVRELPRSFAAVPRALVAGVAARPEQTPRGVPIASQPKVNPIPPVAPSNEQSNPKDREKSREEPTIVVINDRKLTCWIVSRDPCTLSVGRGFVMVFHMKVRPLPASVVDSRISERDNNDAPGEDSDEEPQKDANGEYNTSDLLKQHVKRAKRIRAGLQKDRSRRIERYKQRLALLL